MTLSRLASAAFLSILVASPIAAQTAPAVVTIGVDSYKFMPNPIHLKAGQQVTLTFVNQGSHGHDFTAPEFFSKSAILAGAAPKGQIELAGHETKSITLTPVRGIYPAKCSHFLHASMGMTTQVIVE